MRPLLSNPDILWFDTLDSTNSEAERRFQELDNMSMIAAWNQTAGRGQGEHKWHSRPSENLTFSLVLKHRLPAGELRRINDYITGVLLEFLWSEGVKAHVKLPNDIWVNDKKIAGILIENNIEGTCVTGSIIGVGFNLNETVWPEDLPNPVSLCELTGKKYAPEEVLRRIQEICRKNRNILSGIPEG